VEHLPIIKYLTNCAKKIIQNVPFLPISLQKGRVNAKNIRASKNSGLVSADNWKYRTAHLKKWRNSAVKV
jgi:hypothetical protein